MPPTRSLSTPTSLCLALAVFTASAGPVGAAPPAKNDATRVMVWPVDTEQDVRSVESALSDAGHAVVPFAPVAKALSEGRAVNSKTTRAKLAGVEQGLARAQDHYLGQRWDAMVDELLALQRDALPVLARAEGCGTLWEIEFRLGLGHGARKAAGDDDAATEHFATAFRLDAARRPLGDLYGPDVTAAFLAAVDTANARPARPTALTITPPDARVTVDCKVVDTSTALPLAPGRHAVLVEAPGHRASAQIVTLAPGDPIAVALQPDPEPDPIVRLTATWPDATLVPAGYAARASISGIARARGADEWIVLSPSDGGTRAALWRDGRRWSVLERPSDEAAALGVLRPPAPRPDPTTVAPVGPVVAPTTGQDDTPRKPLVRRWWFWTAIAGGVVATGLGLGLGLGLRRPATPERLEVIVR